MSPHRQLIGYNTNTKDKIKTNLDDFGHPCAQKYLSCLFSRLFLILYTHKEQLKPDSRKESHWYHNIIHTVHPHTNDYESIFFL